MSGKATSAKITISVEATSPDNHMFVVDQRVNIVFGGGTSSKKATLDEPASAKDLKSSDSPLFLDELHVGRYLSTDMVVSDALGNAIHCSARSNVAHNFIKLKEGVIYCIKNFVVYPNKEEYRIRKDDAFMLEFNGATSAQKSLVKGAGFRYDIIVTSIIWPSSCPNHGSNIFQILLDTSLMLEGPFNNEQALETWTSTWLTKVVPVKQVKRAEHDRVGWHLIY
ncbi:hypothetical protein Tco_1038157 [Tanacetum coccineum]